MRQCKFTLCVHTSVRIDRDHHIFRFGNHTFLALSLSFSPVSLSLSFSPVFLFLSTSLLPPTPPVVVPALSSCQLCLLGQEMRSHPRLTQSDSANLFTQVKAHCPHHLVGRSVAAGSPCKRINSCSTFNHTHHGETKGGWRPTPPRTPTYPLSPKARYTPHVTLPLLSGPEPRLSRAGTVTDVVTEAKGSGGLPLTGSTARA